MNVTFYMIIIALYCVFMLFLGFYGNRRSEKKSMEEYFLGGRSIGPVVAFFALGATLFSAFALQGAPANFAKTGVGAFIFAIVTLAESFLFFLFAARFNILGRRFHYITLGDYMEHRYGSQWIRWLVSFVQIVITVPYIAIQLTAFGNLMESFSSGLISFNVGALILGLVMVAYIFVGGYRSVAWTNVAQGILMVAALSIGAIFLLRHVENGLPGLLQRHATQNPELVTVPGPLGNWTQLSWLTWLFFMFSMCCQPHVVQKFFSSKSVKSLRLGLVFLPVYGIIVYVAAAIFGLTAQELIPDEVATLGDKLSMVLALRYLPLFVSGILACGIIAAAMSTADSQYITVSSLITRDFFQQGSSSATKFDEKRLILGRYLVVGLFFLGYLVAALKLTSIVGLITSGVFPFGSQIFIPLIGGLYWKRGNKRGALIGLSAGLLIVILMMYAGIPSPLGINPTLWGLLVNAVLYFSLGVGKAEQKGYTEINKAIVEARKA